MGTAIWSEGLVNVNCGICGQKASHICPEHGER